MDFIEFFQFGENWSVGYDFPQDFYIALSVGLIGFAVVYIFQAITLYTIGKRNGFGKLWMAFVPFFNTYYLGVVSEKNKIFNKKPKYFSLALAIIEFIIVAGWALYYVSFYVLRGTGYISYELYDYYGIEMYTPMLSSTTIPSSMQWMSWMVQYMYDILYYVRLAYILIKVFVLISFFQTYAHGRYFIMAFFSAILPVAGIIMFFVRKNKPMNYRDYIRMVQERQYRQYQQNQRYGNPYNYNPYNGNPNNYGNQNNYGNNNFNNAANSGGPDPFDGFGSSSNNGSSNSGADGGTQNNASGGTEDPFEDF